MNITVLVLGEYTDVGDYVEGLNIIHEKFLRIKKGDLYNIRYVDGKGEFSLRAEGEDLDISDVGNLTNIKTNNIELVMSVVFGKNGCRTRTDDDIIGLYSTTSEITLALEEGMEDLKLDIYYNYLNKSQELNDEPYLLFIIDNTEKDVNTYNNIDYLISKYKCDTEVYTTSPIDVYSNLSSNYSKDGIDVNLYQL